MKSSGQRTEPRGTFTSGIFRIPESEESIDGAVFKFTIANTLFQNPKNAIAQCSIETCHRMSPKSSLLSVMFGFYQLGMTKAVQSFARYTELQRQALNKNNVINGFNGPYLDFHHYVLLGEKSMYNEILYKLFVIY